MAGILETAVASLLLETIFKVHDTEEIRLSLTAAAAAAPSGTFFAFICEVLRLWTIIWRLPHTPLLMETESSA